MLALITAGQLSELLIGKSGFSFFPHAVISGKERLLKNMKEIHLGESHS